MVNVPIIPTDLKRYDDESSFIYVLEYFGVAREFMAEAIGIAAFYSVAVQASCGWQRVALLDSITGVTALFVQLFRVPAAPFDPDQTNSALNANPTYTGFFQKLAGFQRTFLSPLPYDPTRAPNVLDPDAPMRAVMHELDTSHSTPQSVVLIDQFRVANGALPDLIAAKQDFFVPKVSNEFQWKLIAAGQDMQVPDQISQIWALPESNRLLKTMRAMTQSLQYRTRIFPLLTSEQQELFEPRAAD